jgi:hypothetical protein
LAFFSNPGLNRPNGGTLKRRKGEGGKRNMTEFLDEFEKLAIEPDGIQEYLNEKIIFGVVFKGKVVDFIAILKFAKERGVQRVYCHKTRRLNARLRLVEKLDENGGTIEFGKDACRDIVHLADGLKASSPPKKMV